MRCVVATSYRRGVGKLHLDAIVALRNEFYDYHAQFGPMGGRDEPPEKWWSKEVTLLLFMLDDTPIGYIRFFPPVKEEYHISSFVITEKERGKGYGREALKQARAYFKAHGGKEMSIGAEYRNEPAVGLYKSFGFEVAYLGLTKKLK